MKPYKNEPEIQAMTEIFNAYQNEDAKEFEKILALKPDSIIKDENICKFIDELRQVMRKRELIKLLRPFHCIRIDYIMKKMNLTRPAVEGLLSYCISENYIQAKIDLENDSLLMISNSSKEAQYEAIDKLTRSLDILQTTISTRKESEQNNRHYFKKVR